MFTGNSFFHLPHLANCQGWLSNGHASLVLIHLLIQCKWKAWLQTPQAATHSLSVSVMAFGWHSMHGSIIWFLQIAQLSTAISHDQNATAVHFLISNLFFLVSTGALWFELCAIFCDSSSSTSILSTSLLMSNYFSLKFSATGERHLVATNIAHIEAHTSIMGFMFSLFTPLKETIITKYEMLVRT